MRTLVIGIDGLDHQTVCRLGSRLPFLSRIAERGLLLPCSSTFPPDSIPAWASIFTGLLPDTHGIMGHVDYVTDVVGDDFGDRLRGRTFWDRISSAGLTVCILNPFLAYPAWETTGLMASGSIADGAPSVAGDNAECLLGTEYYGGIAGFPSKKELGGFLAEASAGVQHITDDAVRAFRSTRASLCFVSLLELDRIQHFFWRYCDSTDTTHPRGSRWIGVIDEFYVLVDQAMSRIAESMGPDCQVVVVSDHGHGRRCERLVHLNSALRMAGLFKESESVLRRLRDRAVEGLKDQVLLAADRLDLVDAAFIVARKLPGRRRLKSSSYIGEPDSYRVSGIGGANPFGGVDVPASAPIDEVEAVATLLRELTDPATGEPVMKWVTLREELFTGPHASLYPRLLFEMNDSYGAGTSVYGPLVTRNPTHRRVSGGHRMAGVLAIEGENVPRLDSASVTDVADLIVGCVLGNGDPRRG